MPGIFQLIFDLYYFSNSGGDLLTDLLEKNNHKIFQQTFKDPSNISLWHKSKNKKIICIADLKTQAELAYKNKNWLFKYYNDEIFFNNILVRVCKNFSNNDQLVLITDIEELIKYKNRDIKKRLLAEYSGILKQIRNKDFALVYSEVVKRFGIKINNKYYFVGYAHCVDLDTADFVFDLNDVIESCGEIVFSKLNLTYDKETCLEVINEWKIKNYGK